MELHLSIKWVSDKSVFGASSEDTQGLNFTADQSLVVLTASKSEAVVMENHFFQKSGEIYQQRKGSASGVDLPLEVYSN